MTDYAWTPTSLRRLTLAGAFQLPETMALPDGQVLGLVGASEGWFGYLSQDGERWKLTCSGDVVASSTHGSKLTDRVDVWQLDCAESAEGIHEFDQAIERCAPGDLAPSHEVLEWLWVEVTKYQCVVPLHEIPPREIKWLNSSWVVEKEMKAAWGVETYVSKSFDWWVLRSWSVGDSDVWSLELSSWHTLYQDPATQTQVFMMQLKRFRGFRKRVFTVGQLLDNTKWRWGSSPGVYCFVRGETVVYVGRALGKTLGERIWNQLQSQGDPAWKEVVTDAETQVHVFSVSKKKAFMASALEAFLIERLEPRFNGRKQ